MQAIKLSRWLAISLLCVMGLSACSGDSSSSDNTISATSSILKDSSGASLDPLPANFSIDDPLFEHQWSLLNMGQSALAKSGLGGVANQDAQLFETTTITAQDYAMGVYGRGAIIGVLDDGVDISHADLQDNMLASGSYDFKTRSATPSTDSITGLHGTSVAGLAAARGGNGIGIWGMAPLAKLQGFNLLTTGEFDVERASLGSEQARQIYPGLRSDLTHIFNKSYGENPDIVPEPGSNSAMLVTEVLDIMRVQSETARQGRGAIYVKAGGNEYRGGSVFSSTWCREAIAAGITCYNVNQETENNTPYQIVVGAFNAQGRRSSYSNTGSSLWIAAPGGELGEQQPALVSTDQTGCGLGLSRSSGLVEPNIGFNLGEANTGNENCDYYSAFNGSSAAAPLVSGAAALLLEAYPEASWRDIKHFLAMTARQLQPDLNPITRTVNGQTVAIEQGWVTNAAGIAYSNAFGFGGLSVVEAVKLAQQWQASNQTLPPLKTVQTLKQPLTQNNEIANFDAAGLQKTVTIADNLIAETAVVTVTIKGLVDLTLSGNDNHKIDASDYLIELISPAGTKSIVLTPLNAYRTSYDMIELPLATHAFYGENTAGTWTLKVTDVDQNTQNRIQHVGEGKLTEWSLRLYGHEPS
ncbi:hypothetical protein CYQ88_01005 [Hydrogenovibrio sp. SC-1]|uniref:S8 family serine peptidase n=1 Tax=Hydrogenovibrio sp. SC-1 TaxID=2065820 RepID=UPI000C7DFD84|nr:S8 family serine peptidase [Hydrogenovibrio sp. SC-1]PLA75575.1 hypothetical protein CYQ88_01005 [Hydrogenovibrio sp. SC-1]